MQRLGLAATASPGSSKLNDLPPDPLSLEVPVVPQARCTPLGLKQPLNGFIKCAEQRQLQP